MPRQLGRDFSRIRSTAFDKTEQLEPFTKKSTRPVSDRCAGGIAFFVLIFSGDQSQLRRVTTVGGENDGLF